MRFAVEAWAPEYGASTGDEVLAESEAETDIGIEVDAAHWAPRSAPVGAPPLTDLLLVDGVQRVDAVVWITGDDGDVRTGVCGSYAAGAVRCVPGRATAEISEVERGLFTAAPEARPITTRHGAYGVHAAVGDDPGKLRLALHDRMIQLEACVAARAGEAEVVLVDGPLRPGHTHPSMVGFVKTHARSYGPKIVRDTLGALTVGQRTPLLVIGGRTRFTWYLRLPGPISHPWAGIVRLEASPTLAVDEVADLADRLCVTLPSYASSPHKDSRAPQNLVPIGGLERSLRRLLGDGRLMQRALREAASAPVP